MNAEQAPTAPHQPPPARQRVLLLGATGTIGRATAAAILVRGHDLTCFLRPGRHDPGLPAGAQIRHGDVTDRDSLLRDAFAGTRFDTVVSCLASRTGAPADAWVIDHGAHMAALSAAQAAGVRRFVLLSAICVQKPLLAFQRAKLAFEQALVASGLDHVIVRPTAFFKSLSGQVERVRAGRPYLLFGDGRLTACKPISDADLGGYLADCLTDPARTGRILPIGGPGPAITPLDIGEWLFQMTGQVPRYRRVPVGMMSAIIGGLSVGGVVMPSLRDKAEFARIGRYYATESMLVLDPASGRYDADATPETGSDTLRDFHAAMLRGEASVDRADHAVF